MSHIDRILPLQSAKPAPNIWVIVKYTNEGWFPGRLSPDMTTVAIEGASYDFDANEDEFVLFNAMSREFLNQYPNSVLVRLTDMEYIISDPTMSLCRVVRSINAVRNNANQRLLPPLETRYEKYSLAEAAALCTPPILSLEVT